MTDINNEWSGEATINTTQGIVTVSWDFGSGDTICIHWKGFGITCATRADYDSHYGGVWLCPCTIEQRMEWVKDQLRAQGITLTTDN